MTEMCPCKDCKTRTEKCHDTCKRFIVWRNKRLAEKKAHKIAMKRAVEEDYRMREYTPKKKF